MIRGHPFSAWALLNVALIIFAAGCSSLQVTKVTKDNQDKVEGIHIYLPKPYLVATPQPDGTVNFDFVFFDNKKQEYAIQPKEFLGAYTFQIARDEKSFLTQLEYKSDTSLVGQQLASSAGAAATQWYNTQSSQSAAVQTQANTAQANLDAAKESEKAAEAALAADEANQPTNYAAIAADQNTLAQAQATLPIYEAALQRAQQTSQAIAATATAATPGTQSGPTISSYFGQPTWNPPYTVSLPNQFPPILYAIDDTGEGDNEKVTLTAVQSDIKDTKVLSQADLNVLEAGVNPKAQPTFETVITRPALTPSTQTIDPNSGKVTFQFSQPINDSPKVKVQADAYPPTVVKQTIHQSKNNTVLEIDFDKNPEPGNYAVGVNYSYHAIVGGSAHVKFTDPMPGQAEAHFTVQKPGITILSPASQTVDAKSGSVSFSFSKSISKLGDVKVSSGKDAKQVTITPSMAANNTVLNLAFTSLSPGDYTAVVNFFYAMVNGGADVQAQQTVKFTVK